MAVHSTTLEQARAAKAKVAAYFAPDDPVSIGITRIGQSYCIKVDLIGDPHQVLTIIPERIGNIGILVNHTRSRIELLGGEEDDD